MKARRISFLMLALLVLAVGCKKSEDDDNNTPPPSGDTASGTATSDQPATIESPGGARLRVPEGAVPRYANGDPGTMVFSIEQSNDTPTPPTGYTIGTPVYRFGPEGTVFARQVEISIPLAPGADSTNIMMVRINPSTNQPEIYPSHYDAERHAVVSQSYGMSMWFGASIPPAENAWGCVHVQNLSTTSWFTFCVDSFLLEFPEVDLQWVPSLNFGGVWAPNGHFSLASESNYRMPQGVYWICTQYGLDADPSVFTHGRDSFVVADPWNETQDPGLCVPLTITASSGPDTGRCACTPAPTGPVGTGVVQVSLTWYVNDDNGRDMDLHLIEPGGFEIFYAATQSPNGGFLDHDEQCGDFRNGVTENIFYSSTPPSGEYIVKVHYYGDCGTNQAAQPVTVRTVVRGVTHSYDHTLAYQEEVEITRFNLSGAGPAVFLPPQGEARIVDNAPAK